MDADKVLFAAYILLADRIRHASGGVQLNRDRLARLVGYTSGKRVRWILDFLVEIGFLVIHQNYDPNGGRNPDTFDVRSRPPVNYVGPRTFAELLKAADEGWPSRDSLFADLGKTAPEREPAQSATVTELRPSRTAVGREEVNAKLRTVGWNSCGVTPSPKDFDELVDLAHAAMTRYGATLEQVGWYAARKIRESTSNPPAYVLKAFRERAAEIAREPNPTEVLKFEDDPELVAAFARKDARKDTRAAAETGQSGMSVEEADEQIRSWYGEGGAGANAAARLLGTSWPCPKQEDFGTNPEQAMAYYAARDQVAREWIKTNYDALLGALTNARVA